MILSADEIFSEDQAITATAASTNVIDLQAAGTPYGHAAALVPDVGKHTDIPIAVVVTEDFATLTSLTVSIEVDDNDSFSSATTVATGPAVAAASLVAGYQFAFPANLLEGVKERYVRLKYTVGGSNATAGKVTAGIVAARQTN